MDQRDYFNLIYPANLPSGGTWADLGAGSGAFTLALRELIGPLAVIYAVDRDRFRLKELERAWHIRFGTTTGLNLISADFTSALGLPELDGIVMANSLHFYKEKVYLLQHVGSFLKPGGRLLLVEYNVDSGNFWVPYPVSFETYQALALQAGFRAPCLLGMHSSRFLRGFFSAQTFWRE